MSESRDFTVRLPLEDIKLIDRYCEHFQTTRNDLIRTLVKHLRFAYECNSAPGVVNYSLEGYKLRTQSNRKNFAINLPLEDIELIELHCKHNKITKNDLIKDVILHLQRLDRWWAEGWFDDDDDEPTLYVPERMRL